MKKIIILSILLMVTFLSISALLVIPNAPTIVSVNKLISNKKYMLCVANGKKSAFSPFNEKCFYIAIVSNEQNNFGYGITRPKSNILGAYRPEEQFLTIRFKTNKQRRKINLSYDPFKESLFYKGMDLGKSSGALFLIYEENNSVIIKKIDNSSSANNTPKVALELVDQYLNFDG